MDYEPRVTNAGQQQKQTLQQQKRVSMSKSCRLRYGAQEIFDDAMAIMRRWLQDNPGFGVSSLYLTGTDFASVGKGKLTVLLQIM